MPPAVPPEIRAVLRANPALGAVLATDFLVLVASLGGAVILPWWITSRAGASGMAGFSVSVAVATFVVAPVVAPLGDRICKARQIQWGLAALCALALGLIGLSCAAAFSLPVVTVLAIVQVLALAFVDPARDAVLTELVAPEQLPLALRLRKATYALGGILGPLLAGALLGGWGVAVALWGYGALLGVALLVAARLPRASDAASRVGGAAQWWHELRAGLAVKWQVPMERGWTVVNFAVWIFQGPAVGLLIPIKVQSLGLEGHWLGACLGALSVGSLLGSVFGPELLVDRFGRYAVRVGLGFLEGLALAGVGLAGSPLLMLAALTAAGFCNASMSLVGATHRALAIPRDYRVRMFAAARMSTQVAGTLGPALVGMALAAYSVERVYAAWGLLMAACVLGFLWVPRLREFLSLDHDDIVDWYRLQYPAVFRSPSRAAP